MYCSTNPNTVSSVQTTGIGKRQASGGETVNITLAPKVIELDWQRYVANDYNRAMIPWPNYRYSKNGVIEVGGEVRRNAEIAGELFSLFKAEIKRLSTDWKCYMNSLSLEVELSDKEERIPDLMIITAETYDQIGPESRIVTLEMPAPVLVIEVVSPSSMATDLRAKELEYLHREVGEYISIDWRNQVVIVRTHTDDKSYTYNEYKAGERVILQSFRELDITVDQMITGE